MIEFMKFFLLIILGFAAAYIDWSGLFSRFGPRWEDLCNPQLLACMTLIFISYVGLIYYPSKLLVDSIKKRQMLRDNTLDSSE